VLFSLDEVALIYKWLIRYVVYSKSWMFNTSHFTLNVNVDVLGS